MTETREVKNLALGSEDLTSDREGQAVASTGNEHDELLVGTNQLVNRGTDADNEKGLTKNQKIGILVTVTILILIGGGIGLYFLLRDSGPTPAPWTPKIVAQLGPYGTPGDSVFAYPNATRLESFKDD